MEIIEAQGNDFGIRVRPTDHAREAETNGGGVPVILSSDRVDLRKDSVRCYTVERQDILKILTIRCVVPQRNIIR